LLVDADGHGATETQVVVRRSSCGVVADWLAAIEGDRSWPELLNLKPSTVFGWLIPGCCWLLAALPGCCSKLLAAAAEQHNPHQPNTDRRGKNNNTRKNCSI